MLFWIFLIFLFGLVLFVFGFYFRKTKRKDQSVESPQEEEVIDPLQLYAEKIEHWMENEKPYLRKDLQLIDIIQVAPVNRSYLSRIFNDYLGSNFSQYIKIKRVEHVKRLLIEHPQSTVSEIALESGFYSASTMHKAFTSIVGMTAIQYRKENLN